MKSSGKLTLAVFVMVLCAALIACGGNALQEAADGFNSDEAMHAELEGIYTIHAQASGDSTVVVTFRAELEELAAPEVAQTVSDSAASEFQAAIQEMRNARITDPIIVLEFLDTTGNLIYIREFS